MAARRRGSRTGSVRMDAESIEMANQISAVTGLSAVEIVSRAVRNQHAVMRQCMQTGPTGVDLYLSILYGRPQAVPPPPGSSGRQGES